MSVVRMRRCNAQCAVSFIPFAETCLGLGPSPPPAPPDSQVQGFVNLYGTCSEMNANSPREVATLLGNVNELVDNDHCIIDTSGIHSASITAENSRPIDVREQHAGGASCVDDDVFVASAFANPDLTCAQVAAQGLCSMLEESGIQNREQRIPVIRHFYIECLALH